MVQHILLSTEYHLLLRTGRPTYDLLAQIHGACQIREPTSRGTLNGCKSIAWSHFYEAGMEPAIRYASLASRQTDRCPTWHFMLGKNLRRQRRADKILRPIQQEVKAFTRAYELSRNPHYGIYLGQMYRENRQLEVSRKVYLQLYEDRPSCSNIQMRLALGFVRQRDFHRAKQCLDYAEKICPESSMFLHYKGIYHQKTKNYEVSFSI